MPPSLTCTASVCNPGPACFTATTPDVNKWVFKRSLRYLVAIDDGIQSLNSVVLRQRSI